MFFLVPDRFHDDFGNEHRYWSLDFHDQERKLLRRRGHVKAIIRLLKVHNSILPTKRELKMWSYVAF